MLIKLIMTQRGAPEGFQKLSKTSILAWKEYEIQEGSVQLDSV